LSKRKGYLGEIRSDVRFYPDATEEDVLIPEEPGMGNDGAMTLRNRHGKRVMGNAGAKQTVVSFKMSSPMLNSPHEKRRILYPTVSARELP
jgi:hypothetical protein